MIMSFDMEQILKSNEEKVENFIETHLPKMQKLTRRNYLRKCGRSHISRSGQESRMYHALQNEFFSQEDGSESNISCYN